MPRALNEARGHAAILFLKPFRLSSAGGGGAKRRRWFSSAITHFLHCMINDPAISLRRGTFSQADASGPAMPRR